MSRSTAKCLASVVIRVSSGLGVVGESESLQYWLSLLLGLQTAHRTGWRIISFVPGQAQTPQALTPPLGIMDSQRRSISRGEGMIMALGCSGAMADLTKSQTLRLGEKSQFIRQPRWWEAGLRC